MGRGGPLENSPTTTSPRAPPRLLPLTHPIHTGQGRNQQEGVGGGGGGRFGCRGAVSPSPHATCPYIFYPVSLKNYRSLENLSKSYGLFSALVAYLLTAPPPNGTLFSLPRG